MEKTLYLILLSFVFIGCHKTQDIPSGNGLAFGDFNADGDSFVYGAGVSNPNNSFISQLEILTGYKASNHGVGGIGVKELNNIYYGHAPDANVATPQIIYIGINNIINSNSAYKLENIKSGLSNIIANQFMKRYVSASNALLSKSGTWSTLTTTNTLPSKSIIDKFGAPLRSNVAGSKITFEWVGNNLQVLTYAVDAKHDFGSFKVTVDGVDKITYSPNGKADDWYFRLTGTYDFRTPASVGVFGLGAVTHTVVITLLEDKEINIDGIGELLPPSKCASLLIGHICRANATGYLIAPGLGKDADVTAANILIDDLINTYKSIGYPIVAVQTEKFTTVENDVANDGLHYNDQGNLNIAKAYRSYIK